MAPHPFKFDKLAAGTYGSVFTPNPILSPRYQIKSNRIAAMAKLGISDPNGDDPYGGNFSTYKTALQSGAYINFFLQTVTEPFNEIMQVSEVLGDTHVAYFYGQSAPIFSFVGVVLNTEYDRWMSGLHSVYMHGLRGSVLAKRGALATVEYGSVRIRGAMTTLVQSMQAMDETAVQFHFQVLVQDYTELDSDTTAITAVDSAFADVSDDSNGEKKDGNGTDIEEVEEPR